MKKIALIYFLSIGIFCNSQNDEAYVDRIVSEFTETIKGDWVSNKRYCTGENKMFFMSDGSRCMSKKTYYEVFVFWTMDNKTFMKRFDSCGSFESNSFDKVVLNYDFQIDINNKYVKKYEVSNPENAPKLSTKIHSCYRTFVFNSEGKSYENSYSLYDLTNESKQKNLNYQYNKELKVTELDSIIDTMITVYDATAKRN